MHENEDAENKTSKDLESRKIKYTNLKRAFRLLQEDTLDLSSRIKNCKEKLKKLKDEKYSLYEEFSKFCPSDFDSDDPDADALNGNLSDGSDSSFPFYKSKKRGREYELSKRSQNPFTLYSQDTRHIGRDRFPDSTYSLTL